MRARALGRVGSHTSFSDVLVTTAGRVVPLGGSFSTHVSLHSVAARNLPPYPRPPPLARLDSTDPQRSCGAGGRESTHIQGAAAHRSDSMPQLLREPARRVHRPRAQARAAAEAQLLQCAPKPHSSAPLREPPSPNLRGWQPVGMTRHQCASTPAAEPTWRWRSPGTPPPSLRRWQPSRNRHMRRQPMRCA